MAINAPAEENSVAPLAGLSNLGFGIGLRARHFQYVLDQHPAVDWFEIISENFMDSHGWPDEVLRQVSARYPVVPHGVSLSIGSTDPLDMAYLDKLDTLANRCHAPWVSDHLCWTGMGGHNSHDLLPLPYTDETLSHVVARVRAVQDRLGRRLLLENPSSYLAFRESTFNEWDFLAEVSERADCGILLDVNNVYVCCRNHGWDPLTYIHALPAERVLQMHIAGHTDYGSHCIDTHIGPVGRAVWALYLAAINHCGPVATLLEWDQDIPAFDVLLGEIVRAREIVTTRQLPADLPVSVIASADVKESISNPIDFMIEREPLRA